MGARVGIKSQDILIVLKIVAFNGKSWKQGDLADQLGLSRAEVSNSLTRSVAVGLLDDQRQPQHQAILEFILFGLKYVFPAKRGAIGRGVLTTPCAAPMSGKLVVTGDDFCVWPSIDGPAKGQEVEPLYRSVPEAIKTDPALYELLVLVDAIRLGNSKEVKLASDELRRRFKPESKFIKAFAW
jgi:hypothetical protein